MSIGPKTFLILSKDSTWSCICLLRQLTIRTVLSAPSWEITSSNCSVPQNSLESKWFQNWLRVQQIALTGISLHWCLSATHHIILSLNSRTSRKETAAGRGTLDQSGENERGIGYWTVTACSFWYWPAAITGATVHFQRQEVARRSSSLDWCWYPSVH